MFKHRLTSSADIFGEGYLIWKKVSDNFLFYFKVCLGLVLFADFVSFLSGDRSNIKTINCEDFHKMNIT